jgi:cytochrome P450
MPVMQLTRPRMVQLLNILQLPSHLLDLADRYRLPERVLREILGLPKDSWERMIKHSIQNQLTSEEVADIGAQTISGRQDGEKYAPKPIIEPAHQALRALRRFGNILMDLDEVSRSQALDEIADYLVVSRDAEGMSNLLEELGRSLEIRLMNQ